MARVLLLTMLVAVGLACSVRCQEIIRTPAKHTTPVNKTLLNQTLAAIAARTPATFHSVTFGPAFCLIVSLGSNQQRCSCCFDNTQLRAVGLLSTCNRSAQCSSPRAQCSAGITILIPNPANLTAPLLLLWLCRLLLPLHRQQPRHP